jgi:hypothetical protein
VSATQRHHRRLAGIAGLVLGAVAGVIAVLDAGGAAADRSSIVDSAPILEATHLPPLLTARGERVDLRYDVYCAPADDDEGNCEPTGTVFLRAGQAGTFSALPLRIDPSAAAGRYVATVPSDISITPSGFSYYAVFRGPSSAEEIRLPGGGAEAPERSLPLSRVVEVTLGSHVFGLTRAPDDVVARASWGDGAGEVGLEQGRTPTAIGATSFDIDSDGTVAVLDEAHKRLLRWRHGDDVSSPLPLEIDGTLADLAVGDAGEVYVLDSATAGHPGRLHAFGPDGSSLGSVASAERAAQVRIGPDGPVVLQQPSGQWMEAMDRGAFLSPAAQRRSARAGRPLPGGGEIVVLRLSDEIRVALVSGDRVTRSWRITSATAPAEVQLAERLGANLVLVARLYTTGRDEFVVLVLGASGLVRSFSVPSADWAEAAPLSRFRLAGSSLYQLASTLQGIAVDRFDLEVKP